MASLPHACALSLSLLLHVCLPAASLSMQHVLTVQWHSMLPCRPPGVSEELWAWSYHPFLELRILTSPTPRNHPLPLLIRSQAQCTLCHPGRTPLRSDLTPLHNGTCLARAPTSPTPLQQMFCCLLHRTLRNLMALALRYLRRLLCLRMEWPIP